ncbi:HdeD family acid-resistance protein [Salinicola rhizosphaerae]|uniref:Membrane protein n=1 Tax=Salinicola rhizosphaerae TaxID=1443141 RepID=A0ABQ3DTE2_9GAMM|nr:DUF308 domain-containing protein [Salinicola rhizosphaerae]GHB13840.1 membrane protein [Salinicola rhizosphaerae]
MATVSRSLVGRSWWILMAFGVIAIVFGLIAVFKPLVAIAALTWIMGIMALAEGITTLVTAATYRGAGKGWLIFYGAFSVLFGLVAIFDPLSMASALLILVGIWLVIAGIYRLMLGLKIRRSAPGEGWTVLSGVLALLLGILLVASPLSGLVVTAIWIGVVALVYGIIQVIAALRVKKAFSGAL